MPGTVWDRKMNQYGCCPNPAYDMVGAMYQPLTKPNTEEFGERQKYEQDTARVYKERVTTALRIYVKAEIKKIT